MGNGFSIEQAVSDTAVSSKSGMLARIFKRLLHSQFSNIRHGCIILNEGDTRVVFGDENQSLKAEVNVFSSEFYILAGSGFDLGVAEAYAAGYNKLDQFYHIISIPITSSIGLCHSEITTTSC
jgi:hypothetical protein